MSNGKKQLKHLDCFGQNKQLNVASEISKTRAQRFVGTKGFDTDNLVTITTESIKDEGLWQVTCTVWYLE